MLRENVAQALGGVSPWDPAIGRFNRVKAELLMHWRFPPEPEKQRDKALEQDAKLLALRDEAMYGKFEPPEDPFAEYGNLEGFDYIQTDD